MMLPLEPPLTSVNCSPRTTLKQTSNFNVGCQRVNFQFDGCAIAVGVAVTTKHQPPATSVYTARRHASAIITLLKKKSPYFSLGASCAHGV